MKLGRNPANNSPRRPSVAVGAPHLGVADHPTMRMRGVARQSLCRYHRYFGAIAP